MDIQSFFETTLTSAISSSDLTIVLNTAPTPTLGYLVIDPDNSGTREEIYFSTRTGSTLTCPADGRGKDGTSAVAHNAGVRVIMAFVKPHYDNIFEAVYPVGSVYLSVLATNPNTLLGLGTWEAIAVGEALVGYKAGDTPFGTQGSVGTAGEKTHALITAELASHNHSIDLWGDTVGVGKVSDYNSGTDHATNTTTGNAGSGTAHNNIQPSYVIYAWKRTA